MPSPSQWDCRSGLGPPPSVGVQLDRALGDLPVPADVQSAFLEARLVERERIQQLSEPFDREFVGHGEDPVGFQDAGRLLERFADARLAEADLDVL